MRQPMSFWLILFLAWLAPTLALLIAFLVDAFRNRLFSDDGGEPLGTDTEREQHTPNHDPDLFGLD